MKSVFLETHNIKNLNFGFGQFNYNLVEGFYNANIEDFKMTIHAKDLSFLKSKFGNYFNYELYKSYRRYPFFRIRKKYDLWHSLNQNIKIEPHYNIPYLLTIHDVNFVEESPDNKKIRSRFKDKLKRSNAITYISNYAKESTHLHFEVPKVPEYIIYNGNPIKDLSLPNGFYPRHVPKTPFLFSIGELTKRKNNHTLIEMLNHLEDLSLVLAGNDNTEYAQKTLKKCIVKYNLQNRVFMTGKITDLEKKYYLKHCSAFVFPSLREGFGIPPIEAMRFGKPVFLSNNTSLPEIGGKHAFYWSNYDPENMASTLEKGLQEYELKKDNFKKAYIKHAKSFDWDESALQYLKVYKSLL